MKLYRNLAIILAVFICLGGLYMYVSKLEPTNSAVQPTYEPSEIEMYIGDRLNVDNIAVANDKESYCVTNINNKWIFNNDASIKISQTKVDGLAFEATKVMAKASIEEEAEELSAYGLDSCYASIAITYKNGKKDTIKIGSQNLDNSGRYACIEGSKSVYLLQSDTVEAFEHDAFYFKESMIFAIAKDDVFGFYIEKRDSKRIELNKIVTDVVGEQELYTYKLVSPIQKDSASFIISQQFNDNPGMLNLTASNIAADKTTDLNSFGLVEPYAIYSIWNRDKSKLITIRVGDSTGDGRYVKLDGYDAIYVVKNEDIKFIDFKYTDLIDKMVHIEYIDKISSIKINAENAEYNLSVDYSDSDETAVFMINGENVTKEIFTDVYKNIIGVSFDDIITKAPEAKPSVTVSYNRKDGSKAMVEFRSFDERNYIATVVGDESYVVKKKQVETMLTKLAQSVK